VTRSGPHKTVPNDFWKGRRDNALGFHRAAKTLLDLCEPGQNTNPIIAQIVDAAIAYADAVTARYGNRVNQQDHQALGDLLRAVLGNRLPSPQLANLKAILSHKDEASYGVRVGTHTRAVQLYVRLDEFAAWVQSELAR
jgi:hypothetical protein